MKKIHLSLLLAALLGGVNTAMPAGAPAASAPLAFTHVAIVHPERESGKAVDPDQTVLIRGDRIEKLGPSAATPVPAGAQVIDGTGKWLIPGLIDAHVHFFQSANPYTRPDAVDLNAVMPYATEDARNKARLPATFKVWIASGVTSVVDIGGPMWNFDMRDAARTAAIAPAVAVAGPLISMIADPPLELNDPPIIRTATVAEGTALVARELARHPDYIKVWFIHEPGTDLAAQEAIVHAVGDAAHRAGIPLAVHATELETAKAALRSGADYLVHSVEDVPVDAEFLALMKHNKALYCPTLWVGPGYDYMFAGLWRATEAERRFADPQVLAMMDDIRTLPDEKVPERMRRLRAAGKEPPPVTTMLNNLMTVYAAGIPVVMGTDAGNIGTLHGPSVFREMSLMQQAGLTPIQVLRAATSVGARAAHREKVAGVIAVGRVADLVLLDADPTADIANASHIYRVVRAGKVYNPDELIASIK
ncbi:MAG TPA: amidohydrolase family protein [Steroidobacteraceae bacterium]|nr:amidohydrolase family protein [Steroidobacteraceae bacterium]